MTWGIYICLNREAYLDQREKNNARSLILIRATNDQTKTNGVEIIFKIKL